MAHSANNSVLHVRANIECNGNGRLIYLTLTTHPLDWDIFESFAKQRRQRRHVRQANSDQSHRRCTNARRSTHLAPGNYTFAFEWHQCCTCHHAQLSALALGEHRWRRTGNILECARSIIDTCAHV